MNDEIRQYIVNLTSKFQGVPYIWGGSNPRIGFDCSGLIIWVLQVFNVLPSGDWTAAMLKNTFQSTITPKPGDLCFYGVNKITHVTMYIGNDMQVGASGGGSKTTTEEIAKLTNAMVKVKPVMYRPDFVGYADISKKVS